MTNHLPNFEPSSISKRRLSNKYFFIWFFEWWQCKKIWRCDRYFQQ